MTTARRVVSGLAIVAPLLGSCARGASDKAGDSAVVVVDSARSSASSVPQPAATTDTTAAVRPTPTPPTRGDSVRTPTATPAPTPTPTPSDAVLTGRIVAGGLATEPVTSLAVEGGKPTTLVGPLEPELRRLGGATVWVAGAPGTGAPNATFSVSRYEIVSINGARPAVGSLIARDGSTWLATDRDTLKLASPPADLRAKVGAKVWIVGRRAGTELTPQTFGVIREP